MPPIEFSRCHNFPNVISLDLRQIPFLDMITLRATILIKQISQPCALIYIKILLEIITTRLNEINIGILKKKYRFLRSTSKHDKPFIKMVIQLNISYNQHRSILTSDLPRVERGQIYNLSTI